MSKRRNDRHKETLAEKAYERIKQSILRGEFEEGMFLSENEILRNFGIGRTPFREACNRLHHEQLLEWVPRRGYLVPEISLRAVRDLMEVRLILEGVVAELAALRHLPKEAEELAAITQSPAANNGTSDSEQVVRANTDFHRCLARMTHNRELVRLVEGLLDRHERVAYLEQRTAGLRKTDIRDWHVPIVEAVKNRDPQKAREAVLSDIVQGKVDIFGKLDWHTGHLETSPPNPNSS
jgi:DNA-binding GntR family transcriptional regulator